MSNFYQELIGKEYTWVCKKCKRFADTEYNNPPCHNCEDWYGCGGECQLSKLSCKKCGAEEKK